MTNMKKLARGFTLLEVMVYISLTVIIGGILIAFTLSLITASLRAREVITTLDTTRSTMATLQHEISQATSVYTPTTVQASAAGQLSLLTTNQAPAGDTDAYVDFYVDNGRLFMKREGGSIAQLTTDTVAVENFTVTVLDATPPGAAVRVSLTVAFNTQRTDDRLTSRVTLVATTALRSY